MTENIGRFARWFARNHLIGLVVITHGGRVAAKTERWLDRIKRENRVMRAAKGGGDG